MEINQYLYTYKNGNTNHKESADNCYILNVKNNNQKLLQGPKRTHLQHVNFIKKLVFGQGKGQSEFDNIRPSTV